MSGLKARYWENVRLMMDFDVGGEPKPKPKNVNFTNELLRLSDKEKKKLAEKLLGDGDGDGYRIVKNEYIDKLHSDMSITVNKNAGLEKKIDRLVCDIERLAEKLSAAEKSTGPKDAELERMRKECTTYKRTIDKKTKTIESLVKKNAKEVREYTYRDLIEEHKKDYASLKEKYEEVVEELRTVLSVRGTDDTGDGGVVKDKPSKKRGRKKKTGNLEIEDWLNL